MRDAMKRRIAFLIAAFSLASLSGIADQTAVVPDLIGLWKFDEPDGNKALDSSGNGNDGAFLMQPDRVPGIIGNALRLDGRGQCVHVPDSPSLHIAGDQLSIVCWLSWAGSGDYWQAIISKGIDPDDWGCFIRESYANLYFVTNPHDKRNLMNSVPFLVTPNRWHFLAATYDGKRTKIYLDGELVAEDVLSGNLIPNDSPLRIGHAEKTTHWWNGMLDEVAVFRRALPQEEILSIMEYGIIYTVSTVQPTCTNATIWGSLKNQP